MYTSLRENEVSGNKQEIHVLSGLRIRLSVAFKTQPFAMPIYLAQSENEFRLLS